MSNDERLILREHFLEAFVRELILNAYDPSKDKELQKELEEKTRSQINEQMQSTEGMPMLNLSEPEPKLGVVPQIPVSEPKSLVSEYSRSPAQPTQQQSRGVSIPQYPSIPFVNVIPLPQEVYQPKMKPGQKPDTINLGKIASILIDPAVVSVECPGPYKNVLVNRSGAMQASSIALTPEEIEALMQNVSEKTRIPLTSGVFKAAVQDLIVTAVISDFVGTRFLIQKRTPFQRY